MKLPQVICDYCNHITDIDFCCQNEESVWNCSNCHKPYDKSAIEEGIISQLNKLFVKFYSQDLKCDKCNQIRGNYMDLHCKCSGSWIETMDSRSMEKKFQIFNNVANFYNLKTLRGVIEDMN